MLVQDIKAPSPFWSYLRVGKLLYWSLILFLLESYWYGVELWEAIQEGNPWWIAFWISFFLFSFLHIFLVIMDGWSRYQNYKRAKDMLFLYGFQRRIGAMYIGSKCQRMAALVAADELGMKEDMEFYYQERGVKWYHYLPYFMVKDPLFLFRSYFWKRTFMEPTYTSKINFKQLAVQGPISL